MHCLVDFSPLIEHSVRSAWLRFVLRCNQGLLGASAQLEEFLFPTSRGALDGWRPILRELQRGECFYCEDSIGDLGAVDHFLPWTRYARDLGPNFVLAHCVCNSRKSDHLAAVGHLERWCRRNHDQRTFLENSCRQRSLPHH